MKLATTIAVEAALRRAGTATPAELAALLPALLDRAFKGEL